jgi:hypothetical protein
MLGDSYMDPSFGNVGSLVMTAAGNAMYRHYYEGGAAMNAGSGQLNIPYQFETSALMDTTVASPKDVQVVIMDGIGNDVLVDQRSCLTDATAAALQADTACTTTIQSAVARMTRLWQEMATDGVKHIVYYFYPHLDTAGGGLLPTPAPGVNLALDDIRPLAEQACCGASFTSTATNYTCRGKTPGADCVMIDATPAFSGHLSDYISSDKFNPSPAGATVIANLVWNAMVADCIAQ